MGYLMTRGYLTMELLLRAALLQGSIVLGRIKLSPPWYYREQTDLCDRQISSRHLLSGGSGSVEHLLVARPLCIGL